MNFNELPYITLKASPKRKVVCSNHIRDVTRKGVEDFFEILPCFFYFMMLGSKGPQQTYC